MKTMTTIIEIVTITTTMITTIIDPVISEILGQYAKEDTVHFVLG